MGNLKVRKGNHEEKNQKATKKATKRRTRWRSVQVGCVRTHEQPHISNGVICKFDGYKNLWTLQTVRQRRIIESTTHFFQSNSLSLASFSARTSEGSWKATRHSFFQTTDIRIEHFSSALRIKWLWQKSSTLPQ